MKTFKKIVAVVAVLVGILFLAVAGSDIQIGFGAVLIAQGLLAL